MSRVGLWIFVAMFSTGAVAAEFPARPIRVLVGFTPGGGADAAARIVAQAFNEAWGRPAVVENRPGAGGNIATELVAKAPADGYTVLVSSPGPVAINPSLYPSLPFNPERDFAPVTLVGEGPNVLVVHPTVPATTVREFLALARKMPGRMNYASSGIGSTPHLSGALFQIATKLKMVHVPYRGAGPAVVDLMAGRVDLMFVSVPSVASQIASKRLRALAVTTLKRTAALPDVPTLDEAGVPGYQASAWWGALVPAGTPPKIIERLNRAVVKTLKTEKVRELFLHRGADAVGNSPAEFGAFLREERAKWAKVVKTAGIHIEQ